VQSGPIGIAITPDGKTAYVTNGDSDSVTPIDTATNIAGTSIGVGAYPYSIAITPAPPQPDAQIRGGLASAYRGDDIYNQTGLGQTFGRQSRPGFGDQFNVKIENDGSVDDHFSAHGAGSSTKFKVTYWSGPFNVTPDVVAGTFQTGSLTPGGSQILTVFIFAKRGVRLGTWMTDLISVASDADPTVSDVVGARLVVSKTAGDFNSSRPIL
jgi:YVTN family beta-propeller protein